MLKKRYLGWGALVVLCILIVSSYAYILRDTFKPFDVSYYDDLFDHSQYTIAESYRTIGDGNLYAITGVRLIRSGNPFADVPQAPPVGKYIYGYAIKLLGNPIISNYLFLLLILLLSGSITHILTKSKRAVVYCVLLLITNAQLIQQLNQTMLDILQTMWLLGHIYLLFVWKKSAKKNTIIILLSGLCLGLFAATKFGILLPLILLISYIYLVKQQSLFVIGMLIGGIVIGFCLPYTPYIINYGLIQFLKSQKWVFLFWLAGNNSKAIYGMPFVTLLTGMYKHFNPGTLWEWSKEWSPIWSFVGFLYIKEIIEFVKKNIRNINLQKMLDSEREMPEYAYLLIIASVYIGAHSIIPFYPRYLLPISILLIIICVCRYWPLVRQSHFVFVVMLCFGISAYRLYNTPVDLMGSVVYQVNHGLYKDLCRSISPTSLPDKNCDEFQKRVHRMIYKLGTENAYLSIGSVPSTIFKTKVDVPFTISYLTPIGTLTNSGNFQLVRRGSGYNLVWSDSYLLNGYAKGDEIQSSFINGKKGILRKGGKVMGEDIDVPYFVVYPEEIVSEDKVNKYIGKYMEQGDFYAQLKYKVNHTIGLPADIGYAKLLPLTYAIPTGIVIEQRRISGDQSLNTEYTAITGGEIIMKNSSAQNRVLLKRDVREGKVVDLK
ncbi:MAG: hypothetical protein WCO78_01205 [Candidatus Roizmanbacteria bacterium]